MGQCWYDVEVGIAPIVSPCLHASLSYSRYPAPIPLVSLHVDEGENRSNSEVEPSMMKTLSSCSHRSAILYHLKANTMFRSTPTSNVEGSHLFAVDIDPFQSLHASSLINAVIYGAQL